MRPSLILLALLSCAQAWPASDKVATTPNVLTFHEAPSSDGLPLNVVTVGDRTKPGLLFLHGFTQSYMSFLPQLEDPGLQSRFSLAAVDLRGHGASGKPWEAIAYTDSRRWADDVKTAIEASEQARPILVGWSFGGYCIMDYVRHYGTRNISGIVLIGSHGGLLPREPTPSVMPNNDLQKAIEQARWFMSVMGAEALPPGQVARGEAANLMLPPYARRAMQGRSLDNTALVGQIDLPVLILRGERDPVLTNAQASALMKLMPRAELKTYPGLGHSPFAENPAEVNEDIGSFAARLTKRSAAQGTIQ